MTRRLPLVMTAGFRFFFLMAALSATGAMAAWLAWIGLHAANAAISDPTISVAPHLWHGHEMIFGYAVAVIAGFFLTAVPSWTGEAESGPAFVALAGGLWLSGRLAVWFSAWSNPWVVALLDLAFLPVLSFRLALNLVKRPKPQNVALLGLIALIFAGNLMIHLEWTGLTGDTAERGLWLSLLAICALIAVIGGRITPAFTRNALMRDGRFASAPVMRPLLDRAGIATAVFLGPAFAFDVPEWLLGLLALAAGLANAARLSGWRSRATLGQPILWALHLGFALLAVGYLLLALAWLTGLLHPIAAMHGLAIGAVGSMTLAMMTRAPLGHTGRPLRVRPVIAMAYGLIPVAMAIRVFGPQLMPQFYNGAILFSGALWIVVFATYIAVYWPVLTGPDQCSTAASLPS